MTTPAPRRSARLRWAVPAVAAVAVAGALIAPPLLASADDTDLPDLTVEDLLTQVAEAEPVPLAGTVVHTARLGVPLSVLEEVTGADPIGLLDGSSTLRVWTDGAERSRVSLLGSASEYSVVHDGPEAWTYSSSEDEVTHYTLDADGQQRYAQMTEDARAGHGPDGAELPTPEAAARQALERAEEHSDVALQEHATVAGRDAYQVQITPQDDGTLVDRIDIAVDAETFAPLQVQVWSTQEDAGPALEIGYTDVSFTTPDDAVLTFSPPAGAEVTEKSVPLPEFDDGEHPGDGAHASEPQILGAGWESVAVWEDVDVAGLLAGDPGALADTTADHPMPGSESSRELFEEFVPTDDDGRPGLPELDTQALYDELTIEVPEGRVLSTTLMSVLITDDGRVLTGAVPAQTLQDLA